MKNKTFIIIVSIVIALGFIATLTLIGITMGLIQNASITSVISNEV